MHTNKPNSAHDVALGKQHKSISASDVLKALETIEFGDMVQKLQSELTRACHFHIFIFPCTNYSCNLFPIMRATTVYRDLSKNDKGGRKPTSAGARRPSTGNGAGSSASAPPRAKGKERVSTGNPFPPPFTSAPLDSDSAAAAPAPMDIDTENDVGESASFAPAGAGEHEWDDDGMEDHAVSDMEGESGYQSHDEVDEEAIPLPDEEDPDDARFDLPDEAPAGEDN